MKVGISETRIGFNGAAEMVGGITHISPAHRTQTKRKERLGLALLHRPVMSFLDRMCPDVRVHDDRTIPGPHF
jgi:hypothetical protein